jgi:hypothetical protein
MTAIVPNTRAHAVYTAIHAASPDCAERFKILFEQTMFNNTTSDEMALINRFWRLQLSRLPVPTYEERECLAEEAHFEPWLQNFCVYIIPTIVIHQLPHPEL